MAYVPPNSTVKLLSGVPIDEKRDHTLWFSDLTSQYTYFASKATRTFTNVSYIRKGWGYLKVQAPADQLYGCNYMMYQNTSYGTKWFYAFCRVEYINDKTSAVYFTIDNLQTWFFDFTLAQCYVEREHANHDVIGDNLIPEGLELGEYVYNDHDLDYSYTFTSYDVVVYSTFASNLNPNNTWSFTETQGRYLWGIYTGLNIRVFRSIEQQATVDSINSFITAATQEYGKENGIVAMVMIPHDSLDAQMDPAQISHTVNKVYTLDGYTPKNNKLLTSPYIFLEARNCEGAVAVLPQEYFGGTNPAVCQFMITFNITTAPVAVCVPIWYKNSQYNLSEALYINNFPQCSYNTDLYKAYMAQSLTAKIGSEISDYVFGTNAPIKPNANGAYNSIGDFFKALRNELGGNQNSNNSQNNDNGIIHTPQSNSLIGTALTTAVLGGNVAAAIYHDLSQQYSVSVAAPHNTGSNTPDYLSSNRLKGFWFIHRSIRREFAEIIDKFFDRYGYATHRIKQPNIHARQYWTYTKTVGCQISGNIPTEAVTDIQDIFDNGVTFWADPANFGNYSLNNSIVM